MVAWECPTNPREDSGLDPEAVHYYTLDLQFVPPEQWLMHLAMTDPFVWLLYWVGGPIVTMGFVIGRLILVDLLSERLIPGRI